MKVETEIKIEATYILQILGTRISLTREQMVYLKDIINKEIGFSEPISFPRSIFNEKFWDRPLGGIDPSPIEPARDSVRDLRREK